MRFDRFIAVSTVLAATAFADLEPLGAGGPVVISAPTILGPTPGERRVGPAMDVWGTAAPNTDVHLVGADGARWCDVHVGVAGTWRCEVSLRRGPREVSAFATFLETPGPSCQPVPFVVLEDVVVDGGGCSSASGLFALGALLWLRRIRSSSPPRRS